MMGISWEFFFFLMCALLEDLCAGDGNNTQVDTVTDHRITLAWERTKGGGEEEEEEEEEEIRILTNAKRTGLVVMSFDFNNNFFLRWSRER